MSVCLCVCVVCVCVGGGPIYNRDLSETEFRNEGKVQWCVNQYYVLVLPLHTLCTLRLPYLPSLGVLGFF